MRISCVQMNMKLGAPDENYAHAAELICKAMETGPDVLVLPETWNTGFFPKHNLPALCDRDGIRTKAQIGELARKFRVNIVAGSISNIKQDQVFNTALVFDREGVCVAEYDKTHLFTPMGEHNHYSSGDHLCRFMLDDVRCGLVICYDLRFPELIRSLSLPGLDVLFVVSQWPAERIAHLRTLTLARAIENQMFVAGCNSCGHAGETVYGGASSLVDPWGKTLALAGTTEEILFADCDMRELKNIRENIPVFRDRRPAIYDL